MVGVGYFVLCLRYGNVELLVGLGGWMNEWICSYRIFFLSGETDESQYLS